MNDRPINRGSVVAGVFFILVGAAFLLQELDVWDLKAVYVLPVLLIALGERSEGLGPRVEETFTGEKADRILVLDVTTFAGEIEVTR